MKLQNVQMMFYPWLYLKINFVEMYLLVCFTNFLTRIGLSENSQWSPPPTVVVSPLKELELRLGDLATL